MYYKKIQHGVHIFALESIACLCLCVSGRGGSTCVCVSVKSLSSWPVPGDKSHSGHAPYSRPSLIIFSNWSESQSHEKAN